MKELLSWQTLVLTSCNKLSSSPPVNRLQLSHLQRVAASSLVIRQKNLVRNHLGVNILQSDINRIVDGRTIEVSNKSVVCTNCREETKMKC